MPTFTIRDVSDAAAQAIRERAAAAGKATEAYIREWIEASAQQPIVKARYTLKATGENGARAHIRRDWLDGERAGVAGRGLSNASQGQADAYKTAISLVERNAPGDRERALATLGAVFEDVFETA
jgi:plasmid stability protein